MADEGSYVSYLEGCTHYLTEEQQQEGEHHRDKDKLEPKHIAKVEHLQHGIVAQDGDGDIDKVVRYQDGRQQLLRLAQQLTDESVAHALTLLYLIEF